MPEETHRHRLACESRCQSHWIQQRPQLKMAKVELSSTFRLSFLSRSYQRPEDGLGGDEAEGLVERQDDAAEWAGGCPALGPQRPVEHLDMIALAVGAQARHRRARGGMGEGVAAIAAFGAHRTLREGEALDAPDDRVCHARSHPNPYDGCPSPRWVYSGVNCAFPADDTGSSPHVRRPTSRCRRAAAGGRLVGAVPQWLHRVRLAA